jgi:uncharacterized protein (DUF433 family)
MKKELRPFTVEPPPDEALRKGISKIADASGDFEITTEHGYNAYRYDRDRSVYHYDDGTEESEIVEKEITMQLRLDFPEDVMERVDWSKCPSVDRNPNRVHGAWTFGDTRLPLYVLFNHLRGGGTIEEFMDWFEYDDRKAIETVITFAQQALRHES